MTAAGSTPPTPELPAEAWEEIYRQAGASGDANVVFQAITSKTQQDAIQRLAYDCLKQLEKSNVAPLIGSIVSFASINDENSLRALQQLNRALASIGYNCQQALRTLNAAHIAQTIELINWQILAPKLAAAANIQPPAVNAPLSAYTTWFTQNLPQLQMITRLDLSGCTSLTLLPNLDQLTNLKMLDLHGCTSLTSLPSLDKLKNLKRLVLRGCTSLTSLPNLDQLINLKRLYLSDCTSLTFLPNLDKLTNLEELYLRRCKSLTFLPNLDKLTHLRVLDLSGCKFSIPTDVLQRLQARGCLILAA